MLHLSTREEVMKRVTFANSYNRMETVLAARECLEIDEREWLAILGEEWPQCDNIYQHENDLTNSPFGDRFGHGPILEMMTNEEIDIYVALPQKVTIYRGCYANNKGGFSWSLERSIAEKFPLLERYQQSGQALLIKATTLKKDVLAIKLCRKESEVITWRPKHVSTSFIRATGGRV